jgi:hypothetical protein
VTGSSKPPLDGAAIFTARLDMHCRLPGIKHGKAASCFDRCVDR